MTIIETIRTIAPEFVEVPEYDLDNWIALVSPMVSRRKFGKLYELAVAYLICHKLKLNGSGESADGSSGAFGAFGSTYGVGSISDGGTSISFTNSTVSGAGSSADAEYAMTVYGAQYMNIRNMCIVPITIAGGEQPCHL